VLDVGVVVVEVVVVDDGVVVVGVVSVADGAVVDDGVVEVGVVVADDGVADDGVAVVDDGVAADVDDAGDGVVPVPPPVVEVGVVEVAEREAVVSPDGLASRPLSSRSRCTSSCTACTCAAIALGEPPAPEPAIPSSFCSAALSRVVSSCDGCALIVTTIWSAIAVVTQDGQLTFSASAMLIGVIVFVCPTISTSWNDTATVVHALQLASA
jgi:hypothetical protein